MRNLTTYPKYFLNPDFINEQQIYKKKESTVHFIIHFRFIHFIYTFKASINSSIQNKKYISSSGSQAQKLGLEQVFS